MRGMSHNGGSSEVLGRSGTLPALIGACGYQTAAIGKMHFTPQRARHGFDEMVLPDDYYRQMHASGQSLAPMRHGMGQNEIYPALSTVPEAQTLTSWITQPCVEYLTVRRDPSVPFFRWCSYSKPHPPLDPPEPYYSMYRDCEIPTPQVSDWRDGDQCPDVFRREQVIWGADRLDPHTLRAARAAYYGLITHIDYNLSRLFAALHEAGLFDDTLIVFTSDHGEMLGDQRATSKTYFYEPSGHVPFVMRLPKTWEDRRHGQRSDALVDLSDILPTFLTATGGTVPGALDGQDLIGVARDQVPPRDYLEAMVAGRPQPQGWGGFLTQWGCFYTAITDGRYKYFWYPEGGCEQLFDLQTDPHELNNIAAEPASRDQRDRLRDQMIRRHTTRGSDIARDGKLVARPVLDISDADLRNHYRLGCMTELAPHDIRH